MKLYGTVNTEVDVSKYNILIAAAQNTIRWTSI